MASVAGNVTISALNAGLHWFERVHIYPDSAANNAAYSQDVEIDFKNVVAQLDKEFFLYSAYREIQVTLTEIENNVEPGVEFPTLTPPIVVNPQTAVLKSTSTYNKDLTTGLGVPVRETIRALVDGLSDFDDTVVFKFSIGDRPSMSVRGKRIIPILARYEQAYDEVYEFKNNVLPSDDGSDQRLSVRPLPREIYNVKYRLTGVPRQRFQSLLFDRQDVILSLPLYDEETTISSDVTATDTVINVIDGDLADFRVGGYALLITDELTFEVGEVQSITSTTITLVDQVVGSYAAATTMIVPLRLGHISNVPAGADFKRFLEDGDVEFTVDDLDAGTPTESSSAWNSATYDGKPLLDECNPMDGTTKRQSFEREVIVMDNDTGLLYQDSGWSRSKRISQKGFVARSRAQVTSLRRFLRWSRGEQKSFYLPTKKNDLTIADDLAIGTAILDVEKIDYERFVKSVRPRADIRVVYDDGTVDLKHVDSAAAHPSDATQERLTVSTTWGANHTKASVERIEFVEPVNFAASRFVIRHQRFGLARMSAPVITNFDSL